MCLREYYPLLPEWQTGKIWKFFLEKDGELFFMMFREAGAVPRGKWLQAEHKVQGPTDTEHFGRAAELKYVPMFHGFKNEYPSRPPIGTTLPDGYTVVVIECDYRGGGYLGKSWSEIFSGLAVREIFIPEKEETLPNEKL